MEKLEELKRQDEILLGQAKAKQQRNEPIIFRDYQGFLAQLKAAREKLGPEAKAKIIEKLIHKVELLPNRLLIHFYVGQSLLQGELLSKEGGSPSFFMSKIGNGSHGKQKSLNQIRALHPTLQGKSKQVSSSNTIDFGDHGKD